MVPSHCFLTFVRFDVFYLRLTGGESTIESKSLGFNFNAFLLTTFWRPGNLEMFGCLTFQTGRLTCHFFTKLLTNTLKWALKLC
jgi:hypothetical protein